MSAKLMMFVYVDQTATYIDMQRRYARAPRGSRICVTGRRRHRKYTHIGAMGITGHRASMTVNGSMTTQDWLSFVEHHLLEALNVGEIVVLDNLDIHYNKQAKEMIEQNGNALWHQPPYSPECNPIELAWSKMKWHLRTKRANDIKSLRIAINEAWSLISARDALSFFDHAHSLVLNWTS